MDAWWTFDRVREFNDGWPFGTRGSLVAKLSACVCMCVYQGKNRTEPNENDYNKMNKQISVVVCLWREHEHTITKSISANNRNNQWIIKWKEQIEKWEEKNTEKIIKDK